MRAEEALAIAKSYIKQTIEFSKPKVLWENPYPESAIVTMDITLSDSDTNYDIIDIYYKVINTSNIIRCYTMMQNDSSMVIVDNGKSDHYERTFTRNSDTSFTVNECITRTYGSSTSTKSNEFLIPFKIIGRKLL